MTSIPNLRPGLQPAGVESTPIDRWPRVRQSNEKIVVSGYCLSVVRWKLFKSLCRVFVVVLGSLLVLAGTIPLWGFIAFKLMGNDAEPLVNLFRWAGEGFRTFMLDSAPLIGRYSGYEFWIEKWLAAAGNQFHFGQEFRNFIDLHLIVVGLALVVLNKYTGAGARWMGYCLFWPVLSNRVRITFSSDQILLHRWWRTISFERCNDANRQITFRKVELGERRPIAAKLFRPQTDQAISVQGPTIALLLHGFRGYNIACPRNPRDADRIVAACHYAARQSRSL